MNDASCFTPAALYSFLLDKTSLEPLCLWALMLKPPSHSVSFGSYLGVFLVTVVLESPFYLLALRGRKFRPLARAGFLVALNLATHPFIFLALPPLVAAFGGKTFQTLILAETFAPMVEAMILFRFGRIRFLAALSYAIVANLFSWWAGLYLLRDYF